MTTSRHSRPITTLIDRLAWDNHPVQPGDTSVVEYCCLGRDAVVRSIGADTPFFDHDVLSLSGAFVGQFGEVGSPLTSFCHVAVDGEDVDCGTEWQISMLHCSTS